MGKYTVSVSKGPVARRHDQRTREDVERAHKAKRPYYTNCDPERTAKNVILVGCEDTQAAFDAVFADAVDEYNAKQKRKDRRIDSYWRKCQADQKMHEPILEYVFQVGDKDNHPDDDEAVQILTDAFERWQADNPNMHVLWATIHMDEATPHMHVCFAGASKGRKNGLSLKAGMDAAMREQGFRSTKQTPSVKSQWQEAQMDALADVLEHHGHTRVKGKGDKRKHEPVDVYKQNEQLREEQARLEREVTELAAKAQKARVDIARAEAVAAELDEREEGIDARETLVEVREDAAGERERSVRIRERDADEREIKVAAREDAVAVREGTVTARERRVARHMKESHGAFVRGFLRYLSGMTRRFGLSDVAEWLDNHALGWVDEYIERETAQPPKMPIQTSATRQRTNDEYTLG